MDKKLILSKLNEIRNDISNLSLIEMDEGLTQLIHEIESEGTRPRIVLKKPNVVDDKYILDACCSVRGMWLNKNHPNVVYIDIRKEQKGFIDHKATKNYEINPDYIMDFRDMTFEDKAFKLVVFDPPHLSTLSETSIFAKKFGCLNAMSWQADIKAGFNECWRVLEDYGTLIFKWSDVEISYKEVLKLAPTAPLFYNITNSSNTSKTMWFCFMKIPEGES